ncbi:hypothetical protein AB0D37_44395, partial [Streptomyces sp. NPDC048384]|uniref:hypothetical protein n=1 Tax=Streptomyces sp. NPDC048384 TaxID=3155487 RepID=UPI0034346F9B
QQLSAPSVCAGGVVNGVVCCGCFSRALPGWCDGREHDRGLVVPVETDSSVMLCSSLVSMVLRAVHGNRGVLL